MLVRVRYHLSGVLAALVAFSCEGTEWLYILLALQGSKNTLFQTPAPCLECALDGLKSCEAAT